MWARDPIALFRDHYLAVRQARCGVPKSAESLVEESPWEGDSDVGQTNQSPPGIWPKLKTVSLLETMGEVHLGDGKYLQVAARAQENRGIGSSDACGEISVPSTNGAGV